MLSPVRNPHPLAICILWLDLEKTLTSALFHIMLVERARKRLLCLSFEVAIVVMILTHPFLKSAEPISKNETQIASLI